MYFNLGMHFYAEKLYDHAITEFYRSIFLDDKRQNIDSSYYMIGLSERMLGNWQKSSNAFDNAEVMTQSQQMRQKITLAQSSNLIAQGNFSIADFKLIKLSHSSRVKEITNEANILLFISAVFQHNWLRANELYAEMTVSIDESINNELSHVIELAVQHKPKSSKKAKRLSSILPGAGQLYARDYRNGANAFALNGINITLNTVLFLNGYYVDGIFFLLTITERYYNGNRYQAEQSVIKKEQEHDNIVQQKICDILQQSKDTIH